MDKTVQQKIQRWWLSIFGDKDTQDKLHIMPAPTAYRAQLRRSSTVELVMLTEGFRALWLSLPDEFLDRASSQDLECIAVVAGVLAYVTENSSKGLASAAGQSTDEKSAVSELRFYQLLNARNANEFLRRLRRVVQQLNGAVSPTDLARDIGRWFQEKGQRRAWPADQRLAMRWAMDYFRASQAK